MNNNNKIVWENIKEWKEEERKKISIENKKMIQ